MDRWKPVEGFFQGTAVGGLSGKGFHLEGELGASSNRVLVSCPESSQRVEQEAKGPLNSRKVQKADREKLRRDRLNEQFMELGHTLDPDRPKNDKATILADAIQMLKDLASQVQKLKAEHASLSEESQELTQEKNELREEKAAVKSEIDNLNVQYQQRLRCLYPWATVEPSVFVGPPPYPFSLSVPLPTGPLPFHPSIQPYPFFQNQIPTSLPIPSNPYATCSPFVEQHSSQHSHPSSNRHRTATQHEPRSRSSECRPCNGPERSSDYSDVVTELELKMPGSAAPSDSKRPANEQGSSTEVKKTEQQQLVCLTDIENADDSNSSQCSSPAGLPLSSCNSSGGGSVADG
ncbi:hypothetical protein HPP92_027774 [Vanilla planifolia]|uniref:BHLH domain-containing protein n=1 Tax=Vanilla planifolia TaxID=51239 RepID=A0A835P9Z6_VANPL|nr:hypothetical protein HPP92_027774 [Vanilla planifolia]KAG0448648.1 hypothetical protein HPP92_027730 [Vanilla planifolia]